MKNYCTYITIYKGNKLPPFYIGSTSIDKITNKNYVGSVKSQKYGELWKYETKENRELFDVKIISLHNTRREAYDNELKIQKQLKVKTNPLYVNLSYAEYGGGFGSELNRKPKTKEHCQNISKALKGKPSCWIGRHHSEETKQKLSQINKGKKHSEESKKKMSKTRRENPRAITQEEKDKISKANLGKKRTPEMRQRLSEAKKGKTHFSEEHRKRISEANKTRIITKETREKIRNLKLGKKKTLMPDGSFKMIRPENL